MPASRDVVFRILGVDGASPAFNKAAASAEGSAARISRAGDKMIASGRKLNHLFTLPILAIGAASVKAATDFNAAMTRIQTQAGGSAKDVKYLSQQVLAMRNAQQGPTELANSLYHLKSVGMGNAQSMRALRQASDLAAVGHANLEETTNALAGAWRTGISGAKNFHQAVSTLNAVIGAGNMKMEDLNLALGTGILPVAKTFGLTLKDVGSALALFTDEGVPADAAATRLRMSISLLGAPSKIAESHLKDIGLTGLRLANDMRKPNGLIRAIGDLKTHIEDPKYHLSLSQQAQLLSHAFGGGRSSSAILSMINNFDVLKLKQEQVTRSLGKYDAAVAAQKATPAAKFHQALANLQQTGVVIGNDLLPLVVTGAQDVEKLVKAFDHLSPSQKHVAIDAALAVAALGPLLVIGGRLVKVFGFLGGAAAKAVGFMAAPYRAQAVSAEVAALQVEQAQLAEQLAVERAAALIAVAEAEKANAAAESSVAIAAALEGTNSILAANSTAAAENAIEFAAAQQIKADAAVRAAAETDAAWTKATVALRAQMAGATTSMFAMQSAMMGLGIGLTVGTFTRGASTSTKLMSSLGAAGAGAAIGWSMSGGPWGAAIGGLVGGLSSLASQFLGTGHAADQSSALAQQAMEQEKQSVDALLASLKAVGGQYDKNYQLALIDQLSKTGIYGTAQRIGVDPHLVTQFAMGKDVMGRIVSQLKFAEKNLGIKRSTGDAFLLQLLGKQGMGASAERQYQLWLAAQGQGVVPRKQLGNLRALDKLITPGSHALNVTRPGRMDLNADLSGNSAVMARNTEVVKEYVRHIAASATAELRRHVALGKVTSDYHEQIGALEKHLVKLGFDKSQVDILIRRNGLLSGSLQTILAKYNNMPKHVSTHIDVRTGDVITQLDNVISRMHTIGQGATAVINITSVNTKTGYRNTVKAQAVGTMAAFGMSTIPPNTAFTVGENGWEGGVTDSMGRASIFSNQQARSMGFRAPTGYANGTGGATGATGRSHHTHKVVVGADVIRQLVAAMEGRVQEVVLAEFSYDAYSGRRG